MLDRSDPGGPRGCGTHRGSDSRRRVSPPERAARLGGAGPRWPLGATLFPKIGLAVTPGLVLGVFIPGLVFAAAYSIDWTDLRPVLGPIVALAVPGVLVSAVIVAFALHLAVGLPLELAFVVGAITAATDPVAVVATMRRLDVPAACGRSSKARAC